MCTRETESFHKRTEVILKRLVALCCLTIVVWTAMVSLGQAAERTSRAHGGAGIGAGRRDPRAQAANGAVMGRSRSRAEEAPGEEDGDLRRDGREH